jgi:DNA polymerase delta subunit 1
MGRERLDEWVQRFRRQTCTLEDLRRTSDITACALTMHASSFVRPSDGHIYPVLELYGCTADRHSVCVRVSGLLPYFYLQIPVGLPREYCVKLIVLLEALLEGTGARRYSNLPKTQALVHPEFEICEHLTDVRDYRPASMPMHFLKISVALPGLLSRVCAAINRGKLLPSLGVPIATYEGNVDYVTRVMVDTNLGGMQWFTIAQAQLPPGPSHWISECQLEYIVHHRDIRAIPVSQRNQLPPLRVLSFDIECIAAPLDDGGTRFPLAELDPVTQIGVILSEVGTEAPLWSCVLSLVPPPQGPSEAAQQAEGGLAEQWPEAEELGGLAAALQGSPPLDLGPRVDPLAGIPVFEYTDELDMHRDWRNLVLALDPDVIGTYNGQKFDFPYLLNRAGHLHTAAGRDGAPASALLSRRKGYVCKAVTSNFESRAFGRLESCDTTIPGRVNFDVFQYIQREEKLRSFGLAYVSKHFLGETKEDVPYAAMYGLFHGSSADRARICSYCEKDARLVWLLMVKRSILANYTGMARVTGVPIDWLLTKGQQVKTVSLILRRAIARGFILPTYTERRIPFVGAIVVTPKRGYYDFPISTLDFNSLYPNIMRFLNLCYTTRILLRNVALLGLSPDQYTLPQEMKDVAAGQEFAFVKASVRPGLLPGILTELLDARAATNAELKAEKDPSRKQVLNGLQLAQKITANSVYGFTSAHRLPQTDIARTTTAQGRWMIQRTIALVQGKFTRANGYPGDAEVIYGDTDSVMVRWSPVKGAVTVAQAIKLGQEAAAYCTLEYGPPNKLAFECVYYPMLLLDKKKYAALFWSKPDAHDKAMYKGIENARRDWTLLCTDLMSEVLLTLMHKRDPAACVRLIHEACRDVLLNRVPMHKIIMSKGFKKTLADYEKQPQLPVHIALAKRMMARPEGKAAAPKVGDRITYVLIKGLSKEYVSHKKKATRGWSEIKKGELAEDPAIVMQKRLPIDGPALIASQLVKPFVRLLNPVLCTDPKELADATGYYKKNPDATTAYRILFQGDHMMYRINAPATSGALAGFVVAKPTCLQCRAPLPAGRPQAGPRLAVGFDGEPPSERAVCPSCLPMKPLVYMRLQREAQQVERARSAAWTDCQRCQGSLHTAVICGNKDCNNFYYRDMMNYKLTDLEDLLKRF